MMDEMPRSTAPAPSGRVTAAHGMGTVDRRRFLAVLGGALLAACGGGQGNRPGDTLRQLYATPSKNEWPPEFRDLTAETQAMYRYAVVNHDTLQYIPCFRGCVNQGHGSNFDCYVREVYPDGRIRLDTMSFG